MKNKYLEAALIVCGIGFVLLFGVALLPILVALLGAGLGVVVAFAPVFVAIAVVWLVAKLLQRKDGK